MDDWAELRRRVVYEDHAVLALDKPVGISVMGERHETDLVRLAADAGEVLYPVHRIDKVTSGLVLLAKDLGVHGGLTRQFNARTVEKGYLAVTRTAGLPEKGTIDLPLSVGRKNRVRIAAARESIVEVDGVWTVPAGEVFTHVKSYPSVTEFTRVFQDGERTVLSLRPVSGRRHQIRVQLAWIGHPIEGDPLFEKVPAGRTFLHSWRLAVDAAWRGGGRMALEAPPGADFWAAVDYAVQLP
jgi:tRNA pseudouridine32 synthase/23S rRNA pseudouridine746 synthase/23S rRNA pseudouridine1911/1915/1917 synthase